MIIEDFFILKKDLSYINVMFINQGPGAKPKSQKTKGLNARAAGLTERNAHSQL
jgi:hypothetical protein